MKQDGRVKGAEVGTMKEKSGGKSPVGRERRNGMGKWERKRESVGWGQIRNDSEA